MEISLKLPKYIYYRFFTFTALVSFCSSNYLACFPKVCFNQMLYFVKIRKQRNVVWLHKKFHKLFEENLQNQNSFFKTKILNFFAICCANKRSRKLVKRYKSNTMAIFICCQNSQRKRNRLV